MAFIGKVATILLEEGLGGFGKIDHGSVWPMKTANRQ